MNLRVIPTSVHGAIDYVTSPALIAAPEVLRLNGARASALAPRIAGTTGALYSALTDYELGARRVIPMRAHLALDALGGTALAAAPWIFGSARRGARHWLPHALVGASDVVLALTTKTRPRTKGWRRAWSAVREAPDALADLPRGQRAVAVGAPLVLLAALAYAGRRRLWQSLALVADAVEEAADAVEDAADFVEDLAEDVADAARAKAGAKSDDD